MQLCDSFAKKPFAGNVAGVVLDAAGLPEDVMRAVAAELGAPTTGFVVDSEIGPPPAFSVRYFTPTGRSTPAVTSRSPSSRPWRRRAVSPTTRVPAKA